MIRLTGWYQPPWKSKMPTAMSVEFRHVDVSETWWRCHQLISMSLILINSERQPCTLRTYIPSTVPYGPILYPTDFFVSSSPFLLIHPLKIQLEIIFLFILLSLFIARGYKEKFLVWSFHLRKYRTYLISAGLYFHSDSNPIRAWMYYKLNYYYFVPQEVTAYFNLNLLSGILQLTSTL